MISEQELADLSFADAPKIVTESVPGPETGKLLAEAPEYESMTRGGGGFPAPRRPGPRSRSSARGICTAGSSSGFDP